MEQNLLQETIGILKRYNKTLEDIIFVKDDEDSNFKITTEQLKTILDVNYDDGFGGAEINMHLQLIGKDFWLERHEYDGSEWWEYKDLPIYDPGKETSLSQICVKYPDANSNWDDWDYNR